MTANKLFRLSLPVAAGAGCMVALLSMVNAATELYNASHRVGDVIAFTASDQLSPENTDRLFVRKADQTTCTLDLTTLQHSGGSLMVEAHSTGMVEQFSVHWAGAQTSADDGDCGSSADLVLYRTQLDALSAAARDYVPGARPVWLPPQNGV